MLQAAFARRSITPPLGTPMVGIGMASTRPVESVHDDLFVRVLYLRDGSEQLLIAALDLCFVGREECDQIRGALARLVGLSPAQVLLNSSHNHVAPLTGSYLDGEYFPVPRDYMRQLQDAVIAAALEAREQATPAVVRATTGRTTLPMNRRQQRDGYIANAPNPDGPTDNALPVCLIESAAGQPICLMFSIASHPSILRGRAISAEYPGVACDLIDAKLGRTCAMFLQGCGGDSKPRTIDNGKGDWFWAASWNEAKVTGEILARETLACLDQLQPAAPRLAAALIETHWPYVPVTSRQMYDDRIDELNKQRGAAGADGVPPIMDIRIRWAQRQISLFEQGRIPPALPVQMQGMQLAQGVRLIALEGEPMSEHGCIAQRQFGGLATFALGYSNGEGAYLPTDAMIAAGGYEVASYWEYGLPAQLAQGADRVFQAGLETLRAAGIA